ncbi:MAG: TniQ family protein, partial [Burkholderiales bacterium]
MYSVFSNEMLGKSCSTLQSDLVARYKTIGAGAKNQVAGRNTGPTQIARHAAHSLYIANSEGTKPMMSTPDVPNANSRDQDLFDPVIPITWLADEALFSLCSRHHRLSGHRRAATTCAQLFGHSTQGAAHDFPSRIGEFALRTRGQLGSASQMVRQHTILPFYLPFQSQETASRAVAAMQGPMIGRLKFQLGLLTSRFRANHPLKACPVCMRADREQWSTPYWHVQHQLPGVWVCPQHQEPLMVSSLKATGVQRFQWMLPSPSHLIARTMTPGSATPLLSLAQASCELWGRPSGEHFEAEVVADVYRDALRHLGLLTGMGTGRLRLRDIGTPFAEYLAPLRQVDELSALPQSPDEAAREVARLAYRPRSGMHPLRHLILIGWLFGKFDIHGRPRLARLSCLDVGTESIAVIHPA